jgi:glc operon protein GlcG
MKQEEIAIYTSNLLQKLEDLLPHYMENEFDRNLNKGNVSVCIIDEFGNVYGKMYGQDKVISRNTYKTAWTKASQVMLTGMKTGEFEKKVFNGEIQEHQYGLSRPDFIGWDGGQPITLKDGTMLSVGFSGFRGIIDLEIVVKAVEELDR